MIFYVQVPWRKPGLIGAAVALTVLAGGPAASAQSPAAPAASAPAPAAAGKAADSKAAFAVDIAGQKVFIDPETGRLRPPTPEESRELSEALQRLLERPAAELKATQAADGTLSLVLDSSFLNFSIATVGADGKVDTLCVPAKDSADAVVKAGAATTVKKIPQPEDKE